MTDPVTTYGMPHVTIPRDMVEHSRPSAVDQLREAIHRENVRWLSLTPAERDQIRDKRLAVREAYRDERLRLRIADERQTGLEYVTALLDNMATSLGLDPYLAWRRPRANERAERLADMTSSIRRDLVAAGHRPVTSALEKTGIRVTVAPALESGEALEADDVVVLDGEGRVLRTIRGAE